MAQVRSVSELSDVRPDDWAFQALRSLIERYGVMRGYPDRTFRGNRSLTRAEFAAALNQVMDSIEQRLATGELSKFREDFETLRRLQQSYANISVTVRDRINALEMLTHKLELQQFSTTTKLSGQTILGLTNGTNANGTILSRTRLDLNTSFRGNDLLRTQLEAGNNGGDAVSHADTRKQNLLGTEGLLADGGGLDYVGVSSALRISKLYYTFQPTETMSLTVGARLSPRDFIDYNRFANDSTTNFATSFFANNPLIVQNQIDRPGGAGVALTWVPSRLPLTVRALYIAADADRSIPGVTSGGLFGDRNQSSVELEYDFGNHVIARLQYTHAMINGTNINAGGINAEWIFNRQLGFFGRLGVASYHGFNPLLNRNLNVQPWTWAIGATVRNIVIPGSVAGLAIGQPFVEDDLGNATQTNAEAYYRFLINENISFSPGLIIVSHPNKDRDRGTIWEWVIRMDFSF
jgi:hypothetical protein